MTAIGGAAFQECEKLNGNVYFLGNAPTVYAESSDGRSFGIGAHLYYRPGTTGWTDSDAYTAEAHSWNGYSLQVWNTPAAVKISADSIYVLNLPEETTQATAAFYDENGRMSAICLVEARTDENGILTIAVPADQLGKRWQVLLLDEDLVPVCNGLRM